MIIKAYFFIRRCLNEVTMITTCQCGLSFFHSPSKQVSVRDENPDNKLTSCALKALQINSYHLTMYLFWQIGKDLQ